MPRRGDDRLTARLHAFEETCLLVADRLTGGRGAWAMSSSVRLPWISILASSASTRPNSSSVRSTTAPPLPTDNLTLTARGWRHGIPGGQSSLCSLLLQVGVVVP